ncbi:hypothetical protein Pelo_17798 [Pelomyxa schiedti]|nr:hypothetical protein Pelo_17798 [Pelomyxa schiedti]
MGNTTSSTNRKSTPATSSPPTAAVFPPCAHSAPTITLDVALSAADQFVAFACGSAVARTSQASPATRLLASSPSVLAQLGRDWVVCGCRDVAGTVSVEITRPGDQWRSYAKAHLWLCLSPTLGVVRSAQFVVTYDDQEFGQLIGHIGRVSPPQPPPQPPSSSSSSSSSSSASAGEVGASEATMTQSTSRTEGESERLVVVKKGPGVVGVAMEIVSGSGRRVSAHMGYTTDWSPDVVNHQLCNRRWIVLTEGTGVALWRLGGPDDVLLGGRAAKISVTQHPIDAAFYEDDPDVLLVTASNPTDGGLTSFLWHIDLKESFNQRELVLKSEPLPLPMDLRWWHHIGILGCDPIRIVSVGKHGAGFNIFDTTTKHTNTFHGLPWQISCTLFGAAPSDDVFQVFHARNLSTPCCTVHCERVIPHAQDGSRMKFLGSPQVQYVITDAETDTLLAFLSYSSS